MAVRASVAQPELPTILLVDSAALVGLGLAFTGVGLTAVTGNTLWDGLATIGIGIVLGGVATLLIVETQSLLIGEGATASTSMYAGAIDCLVLEISASATSAVPRRTSTPRC